ncbi:MAG TPA: SDR family NAD(P)-dependent oxidoreductase, partial [Gammaproteobacteria bacterium]|nr:SDR family NAD(P)-dependent oxidoreductase [Gammaproteobacteria bacterium]
MYTLITGASSGLGLELARHYAGDGHDLVLVARRRERLLTLAEELQARHGVNVQVLDRDLARLDAAETLHRELAEAGWQIGTLVNNAGFGTYGRLSETTLAEEEQELLLNVVTPTKLSKLYLRE